MNEKTSQAGAELLKAIGQMRRGESARVYPAEQLLGVSARRSTKRPLGVNETEQDRENQRFDQGRGV